MVRVPIRRTYRVQTDSWPRIANGEHLLATAPTGSGKTLTAFLWSLNQFASGAWETGHTRVVYISPLKALNTDIRDNLLGPLDELKAAGPFPEVRVQTRSGDTPAGERQRMLRRPPEILITTPESLSLLLTTRNGQNTLTKVQTVILDEVHAIVDNRRGVQLMTALERLVDLSGEFQRLALSATVEPLESVAAYVGGYDESGEARPVSVVRANTEKKLDFRVHFPEEVHQAVENGQKIWDPLSDSFRDLIDENDSTLFFTNSRRLAEKITLKINEDQPGPLAYAHHGSLARDIRTDRRAASEGRGAASHRCHQLAGDGHRRGSSGRSGAGAVATFCRRHPAACRAGRSPGRRDQRRHPVSDPRPGFPRSGSAFPGPG